MKNFLSAVLAVAIAFCVVAPAGAAELKVKGNLDVYGMWSANLGDFNSDYGDTDNYMTTQRMRTYFTFQANENLKAVLGLEINTVWGSGDSGDWGTDGNTDDPILVKHAYVDFNFPDSKVNVKAGLQPILLPGIFNNPMFYDDAAALTVSAPINDMFGLTVGYTRGIDDTLSTADSLGTDSDVSDNMDMAFLVAPITLDGFAVTPYFGYVWLGEDTSFAGHQNLSTVTRNKLTGNGEASVWYVGANAKLTMFDPLTFEMDLIYGDGENDAYETKGFYSALAASYKFDLLTATLFGTYATGADDDADKDNFMPTLAQTFMMTPYIGGARAFTTGVSNRGFATGAVGVGADGTGLWTVGLTLDKISFVDKLSHKMMVVYGQGTSDENAGMGFDEENSIFEVYVVNKYMIYENLAAINEIGFATLDGDDLDDTDSSYFTTIGFQYKF